uniref:NS2 rare n=1 Tax=Murine minute virus TaxID=10794 RepID=Q1AE20_MUMIV|nr:NS2 rare [Minute virus of mice]
MAGNAYSDEVLGTTNWLKEKSNQEVFSFVFKNEDVQLNGKDIGWNSYKKELQEEELKSLQRGAETTWDQSEDMEWESSVDELTKKFSTLTIHDTEKYASQPELCTNSTCIGSRGPGFRALEHTKYSCCGHCRNPEHWGSWFQSLPRWSTEPNLVRDRGGFESVLRCGTVEERLQRAAELGLRLGASWLQVPGTREQP